MLPRHLENWRALFPARLTAASNSSGTWLYTFVELMNDEGAYQTAIPAREGAAARELNGRQVSVAGEPVVWMRLRGDGGGQPVWEFDGGGLPSPSASAAPQVVDLVGGTSNNVSINTGVTQVILNTTAQTVVTGFAGGAPGSAFFVFNSGDSNASAVLSHANTSSSAGNRLDLPGAVPYALPPGKGAQVVYHPTDAAWYVGDSATSQSYSPSSVSGTQDDYALPAGTSVFSPALSGNATFTGFSGVPAGKSVLVVNPTGSSYTLTLAHDNSGSAAANRMDLSGGSNVALVAGESLTLANDGSRLIDVGASLSKANTGGGGGGVTGSGNTNYVAKFTGSSALGNSSITDDGTAVRFSSMIEHYNSMAGVVGYTLTTSAAPGAGSWNLTLLDSGGNTDGRTVNAERDGGDNTVFRLSGGSPYFKVGSASGQTTNTAGLEFTGGILTGGTFSGSGTVTSVEASGGNTGLTFTGGPVNTSGTLTLGGTLAVASGGTGANTAADARTNLGAAGRYSADVGDNSNTAIAVTHGLNTRDVVVSVRRAASPYDAVSVPWEATNTSAVTLQFSSAPNTNEFRVTVVG